MATTTYHQCPACDSDRTSGVYQAAAFDDAPNGWLKCQCRRCKHAWHIKRSKTHPRRFGLSTFKVKERELLQRICKGEVFQTSMAGWQLVADRSEKISQQAMASLITQDLVRVELRRVLEGGAPWYQAAASIAGREALLTRRIA